MDAGRSEQCWKRQSWIISNIQWTYATYATCPTYATCATCATYATCDTYATAANITIAIAIDPIVHWNNSSQGGQA